MSQRILFIDTETGGLDPAKFSILTLGLALWKDGVVEDSVEIRIAEPEIASEPEAMAVNGIDLEALGRDGLSPFVAVNHINTFLLKHDMYDKKITLGGHNVAFDVAFLRRLYRLADQDTLFRRSFSHRTICTQSIAGFLILMHLVPFKSADGDTVFKYYGCEPKRVNGKHEARGDAVASANALTGMMRDVKRESLING